MPRDAYQRQLERLRADVLEMSDRVCERLERALTALETQDETLAAAVITGDHGINERYLEIEQRCIKLLALQQPVASDLRFVAASFKIITDLERIADLAVNLAEYAKRASRRRYADIDIGYIGERIVELVETAMAAYAADDAERTRDIAAEDDEIDRLCENASEFVVRDLLETELEAEIGLTPDALFDEVSRMLLTIRDLERVGDHAVNIAARTLYMVESDDELIY
ncbi:phosphate signaling complex protein PhoU [Haloterrigena alkaliphila]|uniref:Phosphate-specific transport system accessory protein PhoU n=1 Tax=Haloterrigena alkaliphila TaxID=2816475 RepID=A0A8A2VE33_9EURY|nr:phosphate signaling complex protein PhoU [Haloterrigena alkaliphila]QSX00310.1 phosphate signaling complex protein PhoU [Haloterrigena alkaliphila]